MFDEVHNSLPEFVPGSNEWLTDDYSEVPELQHDPVRRLVNSVVLYILTGELKKKK